MIVFELAEGYEVIELSRVVVKRRDRWAATCSEPVELIRPTHPNNNSSENTPLHSHQNGYRQDVQGQWIRSDRIIV